MNDSNSTPMESAEEQAETKKLDSQDDNTIGEGYKAPRRKRFQFTTRQKAAGGGIAGLIIGSSIGVLTVISGPLYLIHLSQVLAKNLMPNSITAEKRWSKFATYMGARDVAETRLSFRGKLYYRNTLAKLSGRGIDITSSKRGFSNIKLDINKLYPDLADEPPIQKRIKAANRLGIDPAKLKADTIGSTTGTYSIEGALLDAKEARSIYKVSTGMLEEGKISSAIRARNLARAHGVPRMFKVFDKLKYKRSQSIEVKGSWFKRTRAKYVSLRNEKPLSKYTLAASEAKDTIKNFGASTAGKIIGVVSLGIEIFCQVWNVASAIPKVNWGYVVVPSMQQSMEITAAGSEIMASGIMGNTSQVSLDEIGTRVASLTDENGKSVWEGKALNALANNDGGKGPNLDNDYRQAFSPRTTEDLIRGFAGDTIASAVGLAHDVACSVAGQFVNIVVGVVLTAATFGEWTAAKGAALVGKSVLISAAIGFATNKVIDQFTVDPATSFSGPQGGNLLAYGSRANNNSIARMSGGVELSQQDEVALLTEVNNQEKQEFNKRGVYARLFDIKDYRSVSSIAIREVPLDYRQASSNLASTLLNPIKSIASSLAGIMPLAHAASKYDYGFPLYGMPNELMNDQALADPFDNAEIAAKYFEKGDYIAKAKKCFGVKIYKGSNGWDIEQEDDPNPAESDYSDAGCDDFSNAEWKRVSMFVYDSKLMSSIVCYQGLDESSCTQNGFSDNVSTSTIPSTADGASIIGDPYTESESVSCAQGTKDLGVFDAYSEGKPVRARLCALKDILASSGEESNPRSEYFLAGADGAAIVNSRVSGAWVSLVKAAQSEGVALSASSSFRTMQHQEKLCQGNDGCRNGDNNGVARPGYSSHQAGVAIDFSLSGGTNAKSGSTCDTRDTRPDIQYQWLRANASRFGFKQYANEAWHFDALPNENRCL